MFSVAYRKLTIATGGETILVSFELQHWCCGPKGCELEIVYGEMIDAE